MYCTYICLFCELVLLILADIQAEPVSLEDQQQPFNYIAFSQMLYGDRPTRDSKKAVSFV